MYLQLGTRFNPFTYDEMVKPLLYYKQAYDEAEAAYSDLATQTEAWKNIANRDQSPQAFEMFQRYSGDLSRAIDDFSQGMTAKTRRALLGLKRRYASDIQPIADAHKRRAALAEEQRKAITANPTLRYQRMANQMSLDDFIRNPSLDYGESYSGALLTQQVSQAAANLQRVLTDKGQLQKLGLPYQYEIMLQYGATPSQVLAAMAEQSQNEPETATFLRGIVDQVMHSSGVSDWADPATLREFRAFANQGLYNAIGQAKLDNFTDQAGLAQFKADLDDRNTQRAEARRAARATASADADQLRAIQLSGVSYLSASGQLGKYERALSGLKGGQQGIKATIFGKDGTVNPVTVYDQAQTAMSSAESRIRSQYASKIRAAQSRAAYEVGGVGPDSGRVRRLQSEMNFAISSARNQAYQSTLQRYGVTQGITKDQYDALKAIGYKGDSPMLEYSQLTDPLNAMAQQRTYYSTNMSGYDIPDQKIRGQLGNWENNGSFSTRVYKLNADGTQGAPVKYKDLNILGDDNSEGRKVTGIYYSAYTPGKVIVQLGESGDRYLMDPNVLGSEVAGIINQASSIIRANPGEDLTIASVNVTSALSRMLNSYNPTAPKSSKDAAE